uniref:ATP binding cassette subfamily A member 5 n=1 Tax=Callorhinchus milii TaxID=7868 RepID=A0A4W3K4I1_CALMI
KELVIHVIGKMMGLPSHVGADIFSHLVTSLYFVIAFVPFVNFLLINLVIEKKEVKEVMKVMGLYDSAFWLSWGLLYLVLIFILSLVMAIIATETSLFPRSSIIIIFPLLFLFGISIYLAFFRLNGVRKLYKEKEEKVEALKGLTFDVYQDQITALLGHSGTGKTTLINILSGLCPLSEGSATVFGYRVSELDELVEIRKMIGVCPQFDVLFYSLTVKEHLKILAMIKGIPSQEINNEVLGVLKELDLEAVMDVRAEKLSGGQKRKLSLGMAILGDPKVLLLDEPTAGMDPCSRQQVWTLLKKRKAGRVILLTTHFMDEADILADRKAVISQGQLKCVGSSLFLKAKFGVGYHLRMSVKESCDSDHVTSLVKRYIPNARLSQVHDLELAYTLPLEDVNKFADLFVDLDHHMDLGIDSYGVSMTSLEEVFLKLEAESEIDQTGSNIDKLIHGLEAQNVEVQLFGDTELMDVAPHNAALNVSLSEEVTGLKLDYKPFSSSALQIKSRSQLRLSGLFPSAYWCGYALVDIPVYFVIVAVMLGCVIAFNTTSLLHVGAGISMVSKPQALKCRFSSWTVGIIFIFLSHHRILPSKSKFKINTEEPENEDDDVKIERARVKEAVTCQSCEEKPVIVVSSLRKVYTGKSRMCKWFSKKKKKNTVATKNVSFCVRKGEVLGLLGPNGAGKSTTISMITGDLEPSAGQKKSPVETLGYCAQVNPLWPKISVEEHLEIYAAIKGLSKEDAKDAIKRIVKALELKEHLQKPTKKVSTGIKRKLCFALCMLGNPHIVLMDEPSTGMDPKAKQFMWRAIRAAFKDRQRGAILTTHYMEEAEALCDRVAIMVSGQLRCIGTIQHLKSKYGGGYTLEMKLKDEVAELQRIAEIHEKIMQIFPHASRQESFAAMLTYKIPKEDVKSLSEAFSQLEEGKSHNTELSVTHITIIIILAFDIAPYHVFETSHSASQNIL